MEDENTKCYNCKSEIGENTFCPECGYPERGTDEEKNKFEYRIKLKKDVVNDAQKKVKGVKTLLYILAGINVIAGLFYIFGMEDGSGFADGIGFLITALVFIGCSIWVNNQPLTGILAAFGFYLFLLILGAIFDPGTIFQGLLMKIIVIGVFSKGISSARDAKKYASQLAEMGVK